jgi:hypothetical protein
MLVQFIPLDAVAFTPPSFPEPTRLRFEEGLAALAHNILQVRLLHPILVRQTSMDRYRLIAGTRRLLAHLRLRRDHSDDPRWRTIAAHIYTDEHVQDVLLALAENRQRGDPPLSLEVAQAIQTLPPSEQFAFVADVRREMAEQARGRQAGGKRVPQGEGGKTSARAPTWVERATAVLKAAEEDPEHFGQFARQLDDSGRAYCALPAPARHEARPGNPGRAHHPPPA